jgi:hypothetical protein
MSPSFASTPADIAYSGRVEYGSRNVGTATRAFAHPVLAGSLSGTLGSPSPPSS